MRLRDRDAIITAEEIIFRVYGYAHPADGYVCDVEYAPSKIFKSTNPKAYRRGVSTQIYYKFFEDEGLKFVHENFPRYQLFHEPLQEMVVGVKKDCIVKVRKPDQKLMELIGQPLPNGLHAAMLRVLKQVTESTSLTYENFGVFGSLLHGFYHPKFSDIDLIIYGKRQLKQLREYLDEAYRSQDSSLRNEFETLGAVEGKNWRFVNYSPKEFLWQQHRKLIYGLFKDEKSGRVVKTEFEPVKEWNEIRNEYFDIIRIKRLGWIRATVRVIDDSEASFMPAAYLVETLNFSTNAANVESIKRVISYVEEFRMQAFKDEVVYVEGNLEEVTTHREVFHQITLTLCPRYYEQVMKVQSFT